MQFHVDLRDRTSSKDAAYQPYLEEKHENCKSIYAVQALKMVSNIRHKLLLANELSRISIFSVGAQEYQLSHVLIIPVVLWLC